MEYLWEQYIKDHPNGYKLTQYKKYIGEYRKAHNLAYMNHYRPGEEMQVDFAEMYITFWINNRKSS